MVTRSGGSLYRRVRVASGEVAEVELGRRERRVEVVIHPPPPAGWRLVVLAPGDQVSEPLAADGRTEVRWPQGPVRVALGGADGRSVVLRTVAAGFDDDRLDVDLPPGGVAVEIRTADDEAASGRRVELVPLAGGESVAHVVSDAAGRAEFHFVAAGSYAVAVDGSIVRAVSVREGLERLRGIELSASGR